VDQAEADEVFDNLEFLLSLEYSHWRIEEMKKTGLWYRTPFGGFIWKNREVLLDRYSSFSADHPILQAAY
jgi:hypothetical protein